MQHVYDAAAMLIVEGRGRWYRLAVLDYGQYDWWEAWW